MVPYVNASILALVDENEFDFRPQNGIFFSGIHNLLTLDKIFYENLFLERTILAHTLTHNSKPPPHSNCCHHGHFKRR